jgi:hypothetical protein
MENGKSKMADELPMSPFDRLRVTAALNIEL